LDAAGNPTDIICIHWDIIIIHTANAVAGDLALIRSYFVFFLTLLKLKPYQSIPTAAWIG
jgi:hypothetical protein